MLDMSDTIKTRRRALGMTQAQLAQLLGVSGPAVSKWEQGASYPDVTLLPALARALQTDVNTLMGFCSAPGKEEIAQILTRVNDTAKEQGIEAGIALAQEIVREYPDSGALLFGLAATLEGRIVMSGADRAACDTQLETWYRRAADSADPEAGEAAAYLLASRYLARGDINSAQEMMERLPPEPMTARWTLEIALRVARGEKQQARRQMGNMLFQRAGDVQQILLRLVQAELEDGNVEKAQELAGITKSFVDLLHMHPYTGHAAQLMPALQQQDTEACMRHLRAMFSTLERTWTPGEGLLYAHAGVRKSGYAGQDMLGGIIRALKEDQETAFLRENAEFREIIERYAHEV